MPGRVGYNTFLKLFEPIYIIVNDVLATQNCETDQIDLLDFNFIPIDSTLVLILLNSACN